VHKKGRSEPLAGALGLQTKELMAREWRDGEGGRDAAAFLMNAGSQTRAS
jgi:hypothetical protein